MNLFSHVGRYSMLLGQVFKRPEKGSIYFRQTIKEIESLGINSLPIVAILSVFMGAVITIQTVFGIESSWIPLYVVGFTARESIILEFSPTILSLILAGKVGSHIASEIGTMRVTEQIDALEIMGVNSAGYLILPKVIGAVFIFPFLVILSMGIAMFGGWFVGTFTGIVNSHDFFYGLHYDFKPFNVAYALIKTEFFAFIIITVSAYCGYYTKGGALEVGRASTQAVVYSTIMVLLFNYLLTQLLLG
ncbi:MAG TPA: ABC transporter permease [Flavobacteriales bacterium]|nr:ABC transporter permease [Flavobacteriales bacterium]HIN40552.1 ABC transporter permease [Flavobacteriales bacterium]